MHGLQLKSMHFQSVGSEEGSLAKVGGKKLAFARRQILQQSSTLIVHLYFSSTLSFCTFLKKYQKQGSRVRHSVLKVDNIAFSHPVRCKQRLHCARLYAVNVVDLQSKFKSRFATSFSRCTPRRSLLVAMLGVARTRCAQTSCHLFPSIARLLTAPPNAAHQISYSCSLQNLKQVWISLAYT